MTIIGDSLELSTTKSIIIIIVIAMIAAAILYPIATQSTTQTHTKKIQFKPLNIKTYVKIKPILTIYKIVNGKKILAYKGIDPPTENFWNYLLHCIFRLPVVGSFVATDGTTSSMLSSDGSIPMTPKICVGTGTTPVNNTFSLFNLESTLECVSVSPNGATYSEITSSTSAEVVITLRAFMTFTSSYNITEVGYVVSSETASINVWKDFLMFYTYLPSPIFVNATTPLLVEYKFVINIKEPFLIYFARLMAAQVFGLWKLGKSPINVYPATDYFGDETIYLIAKFYNTYLSYSPTVSIPSSFEDSVRILGEKLIYVNETFANFRLYAVSSKNITATGLFIELYASWEAGTITNTVYLMYIPLSASGLSISTDQFITIDISFYAG